MYLNVLLFAKNGVRAARPAVVGEAVRRGIAGGNAERRRAKRAAERDLHFLPLAALGKV